MCKRLIDLRLSVSAVLVFNQAVIEKRQQLELSNEQWTILEATCELLEPFAVAY